jgi:hypothetical protein
LDLLRFFIVDEKGGYISFLNLPIVEDRTKRVFKWCRKKAWGDTMLKLLADKLDQNVLDEIRRRNPPHLRDDGLACLNESVAKIKCSSSEDIPMLLAERIKEFYLQVIAFHGCRLVSLGPHLKNGLLPSNTESLREEAKSLFGDTPALRDAINELSGERYENHNQGKIWLCVCKESYFHRDGHQHYLLRGSEYLSAIADHVGQVDKLRTLGIPTIIECLVETPQLPPRFWSSISRSMIEDWLSRFLQPNEPRPISTLCTHVITAIPPKHCKFLQFKEVNSRYSWRDFNTGELQSGTTMSFRPLRSI